MRVRKLALAVGLVSALGGNGALALGLGEVKLTSTLNQPLKAEISLLQTRGLTDGEIKVRLASPEDFERAGVDRSYLLTELQFDVDYSSGAPVIRITSREPIREPFLNFLVETRWPSGRLLREYTLLMDLPAFANNPAPQPVRVAERDRQQVQRPAPQPVSRPQPRPVQQPVAEEPRPAVEDRFVEEVVEPQPVSEPRAQEPAVEEPLEFASEGQSSSQVYGPVSANQTLWEIARDNRASGDLSVQQTMLAIQRLNPEAFINNNINLLKRGAVLRLPSADEVRNLNLSQAISEVAVQNDAWRARTGAPDEATGAPLDGRAAAEETATSDTVEGRVSLAAPGDNESVLSGSGSGAEDSEALAGELAVTEEELDKSRLEGEELQERISELDEQIDTMERMVEVSNEEMQAIQTAAEQTDTPADSTEVDDAVEEVAAAGDALVDEPTAAEEPAVVNDRNRVVSVQTTSEPTLLERLMENIQLIGIGAGALLIGLFGFLAWRRRKEDEEAMRQVELEMAAERSLADAPATGEQDDNLAAVESMEANEEFEFGEMDSIGTDDPISEAEIHLSLGQYTEAEQKLLVGLEQSPQNVDARLMLLEVYAHQEDIGKFDDHYRQLLSVSDGPVADRAARLRESIGGAEPFEAPEMDFTSESLEATQLDDISASFEDDFAGSTNPAGEEPQGDSSLLDDLTMDLAGEGDAGAQELSSDDDFSLDLDLDGDFSSDTTGEQDSSAEQDFNLDDLMSGDLELDSLDLDGDSITTDSASTDELSLEVTSSDEPEELGSIDFDSGDGGLDFDLDLSPMEEEESAEPAAKESVSADAGDDYSLDFEPQSQEQEETAAQDDQEAFGSDLDEGLDLDSIDLDDITSELSIDGDLSKEMEGASEVAVQQPESAQAPAEQPAADADEDFGDLSFNLESDLDSELNLLEGSDEVGTKLELAQAYLDMGDKDGAKDILTEVVEEGTGDHKSRAQEMLERLV